ncbi:MAG: FG-GAP-like repeat-containing protein [Myxococcota bacterium]
MDLLTSAGWPRLSAAAVAGMLVCGCFDPNDSPPASGATDSGSSTAASDPSAGTQPSDPTEDSSDPSGVTESDTEDPSDPSGVTESDTEDPSDPTQGDTDDPTQGDTDDPTDPSDTDEVPVLCGDGTPVATELCFDDPPNTFTTPPLPTDVVVGDISSNGLLDIVMVSHGQDTSEDGQLAVLEADGVGGYIIEQTLNVPSRPARVRLADADGDDDLDIFVHGNGTVMLRNAGSFFSSTMVSASPLSAFWEVSDVWIADVDGDEVVDVGMTQAYSREVVLGTINNGNWSAGNTVNLPGPGEGSSGMAAGAMSQDDDDDVDVVLFNQYYSSAFILANNGSGMFNMGPEVQLCPADIDGVRYGELADFNDDGVTDILATCVDGDAVIVLGTDSGFTDPIVLPLSGAWKPYAADMDGDGDLDVLVTSRTLDRAVIFVNDGIGAFELSEVQFMAPGAVFGAAPADLNDDGAMDVVLVSAPMAADGRLDIYLATP